MGQVRIIAVRWPSMFTIRVAGLLTRDEAQDDVRRMEAEVVAGIGHRPRVMLIDTGALPLQSREVVESSAPSPLSKARRIAIVDGESLVGMQQRRILDRDHVRFFAITGDATGWLPDHAPMAA